MRVRSFVAPVAVAFATSALAQQRAVTAADYARAERYMSYETTPLVFGTSVRPTWLPDDRFWYRSVTPGGADLVVVDPAHATRVSVFANASLAGAVAAALGASTAALSEPSTQASLSADGKSVIVSINGRSVTCDVASAACHPATEA